MQSNKGNSRRFVATTLKAGSMVAALICPQAVLAFDVDLGNSDLSARWDNNLRYTLGERVQAASHKILNATNYSDGDANFKRGMVTNRVDLLSEADIVYKKLLGARVSGAFWYDQAYASLSAEPTLWPNQLSANNTPAKGLGPYARRYYKGPSGELMDAFVFINPEVADMSTSLKIGRHTVIWGEGLYLGGAVNGISYGQAPVDIAKA